MTILELKQQLTNREFRQLLDDVFRGYKTAEQVKREFKQ